MDKYNLITKKIIPDFLRNIKSNYVVLGGKAFELYFKDLKSDDWDIVTETNPKHILELLENELHRRGIHDLEYAEATDPNGDKVYQLGLKSYKGPDYEERFFIDIKKGTISKYNPIKLNGINVASLEYLYNDGKETLGDRKEHYRESKDSFVDNSVIHSKIDFLKTKIKREIIDNYKIVANFYENILSNFKESALKTALKDYLNEFTKYYGSKTNNKKINEDLEENYEDLYDEHLDKYYSNVNEDALKGKKRDLYEFIKAHETFMEYKKQYEKRNNTIKTHSEFLKTQTAQTNRIKTKYLKSFRRNQAFMNIIKHLNVSVFTVYFIDYMRKKCKNHIFKLVLGESKIVKLPCNRKSYTKKTSLSQSTRKSKSKRKYKTI